MDKKSEDDYQDIKDITKQKKKREKFPKLRKPFGKKEQPEESFSLPPLPLHRHRPPRPPGTSQLPSIPPRPPGTSQPTISVYEKLSLHHPIEAAEPPVYEKLLQDQDRQDENPYGAWPDVHTWPSNDDDSDDEALEEVAFNITDVKDAAISQAPSPPKGKDTKDKNEYIAWENQVIVPDEPDDEVQDFGSRDDIPRYNMTYAQDSEKLKRLLAKWHK